jgi:ribose 5-phosphate isomerase B
MNIYIGADHAGFKLKESMKEYLRSIHVLYTDLGNTKYEAHDDYPVFAMKVAKAAAKGKTFGILFCGSAQGMSIAANKIRGVRAVAVNSVEDAKFTRLHNDANVLCLSGWNTNKELAKKLIKTFLTTKFSNVKRHKRRVEMIKRLEK